MANDATNILVAKPKVTGGAFVAPLGTALPTTEAAALNVAFESCGFVTSDGLVMHNGSSTTDIRDWSGAKVRVIRTEHDLTFDLGLLETNETTLGVYFGTNHVVTTAATESAGTKHAIEVTGDELPALAWVFEIKDTKWTGRIVVPNAQATPGDLEFKSDNAASYPITLEAFPDADGVKAYIYLDDGVFDEA
jgi:hypothetical protein